MESVHRRIKFDEHYKLDPMEKLRRFNMIPYELIIHLLLVIFSILQSIILVGNKTIFLLAQEKTLKSLFTHQSTKESNSLSLNIYTPNELQYHVKTSIEIFYHIQEKTLDIIDYDPMQLDPIIEFNYIEFLKDNNKPKYHLVSFNTSKHDYGIFDKSEKELKKVINTINYFKINYTLIVQKKYMWIISQKYDFSSRGHIIVTSDILHRHYYDLLDKKPINTKTNKKNYQDDNESIHLIVFFLAWISMYFSWKHISYISQKYNDTVKKYDALEQRNNNNSSSSCESSIYFNPYDSDNRLVERTEMNKLIERFGNKNIKKSKRTHVLRYLKWSILCFIGNIIQVIGSGMALLTELSTNVEILLGVGALIASVNIGRYIELGKIYSGFYNTLHNSILFVGRYLLGVFPIISGFIFFGVCLFWQSQRFSSVGQSLITLFSLMEGDSVLLILNDLKSLRGIKAFIGVLYGVIFVIMTIMIILNIFLQIIDHSYIIAKLNNKSSWVYQYIHPNKIVLPLIHDQPQEKQSIKRVQSMPKQLYPMIKRNKPKASSFYSKNILTNKSKELSNNEESFDKKTFNPSYRKKEMIENSLSYQHSIMEDEERSASSHSKDKEDIVILERSIKTNHNTIKNYFTSVSSSLSHIKNIFHINYTHLAKPSLLKQNIMKDLDIVNKSLINLKESVLKHY